MVDDTSVKTPMQRHREFAVSALIGVAALVVALLLKAPLPYSCLLYTSDAADE